MPAKPTSALPNPAAVHAGEADILAAVLSDLADDTAKLVYADWLEERDDPRGPLLRAFVTAFRTGSELPDLEPAPKPWRDLLGLALLAQMHGTALAPHADRLMAFAKPAIEYTRTRLPEGDALPLASSKLGGLPDLPPEVTWPGYYGEPMGFLGQFNFAELRTSSVARELPVAGVLSLFCLYDPDRGEDDFPPESYRVMYFPDASALAPRPFPPEFPDEARVPLWSLTFAETQTLPDLDSPWAGDLPKQLPGTEETSAYENVLDITLGNDHLLGYPHLLRTGTGKQPRRHLVTVGDDFGWVPDDVMYFILPEADLKQGRFDRVKMTLRSF